MLELKPRPLRVEVLHMDVRQTGETETKGVGGRGKYDYLLLF
jgi:hypothetical protein